MAYFSNPFNSLKLGVVLAIIYLMGAKLYLSRVEASANSFEAPFEQRQQEIDRRRYTDGFPETDGSSLPATMKLMEDRKKAIAAAHITMPFEAEERVKSIGIYALGAFLVLAISGTMSRQSKASRSSIGG